jgi:UDP-N-acetylmuramoyl-L-alanyl-D-glutamate--2,6-diaminopimelate ligase
MLFSNLIVHIRPTSVLNNLSQDINAVVFDSRKANKGSVFVAIKGEKNDGHDYITNVIANGCTALVVEKLPAELPENCTFVVVNNTQEALGWLAATFYDFPSRKLQLVGITGTNGKTTTATLLYRLTQKLGYAVGLISTVENKINNTTVPATHTTPDAVALNKLLNDMIIAGCDYAFMEVSSHALQQHRTAGVTFTGAVFTNITHDHLDYHKTMKQYIAAKKLLFDGLAATAFALTNKDDKNGLVMLQNTKARKLTYSLRTHADYKTKLMANTLTGLQLNLAGHEYHGRLIGEFNAYNTTAIYGTAIELGFDKMEVLAALSDLPSAEGRFETITNNTTNVIGIVDYAHTPDALENVLQTVKQFNEEGRKVITVIGCGGDRDTTKRPIMAQIAANYSDTAIFTADNPRSEDPNDILQQMEIGVSANYKNKILTIANREQAIKTACILGAKNSIIIVAGKGHEKFQEIAGVKHSFDDKVVLTQHIF